MGVGRKMPPPACLRADVNLVGFHSSSSASSLSVSSVATVTGVLLIRHATASSSSSPSSNNAVTHELRLSSSVSDRSLSDGSELSPGDAYASCAFVTSCVFRQYTALPLLAMLGKPLARHLGFTAVSCG